MRDKSRIKLWSVGGGKGGVGKSIFTLGLGICLSQMGKRVILIDGDLGGANLHTLIGVRYPQVTLEDFLLRKVSRLEDTIIKSQFENIGLICGADDILGAANPTYAQKIRLIQQIEELPADVVLLDLGAGTSFNTLDLFNFSLGKIVVFTSQVTSLQNAYGFVKSALYRKLSRDFGKDEEILNFLYQMGTKDTEVELHSIQDLLNRLDDSEEQKTRVREALQQFRLFLLVNMVKGSQDLKSADIIKTVCRDFLSIEPQVLGHLAYDTAVETAVNQMTPFPIFQKKGKAAASLQQIAHEFLMSCRLAPAVAARLEASPAY
jgi:flagellar biosynthesis protein FlhG